jgi:hypothetical protein
VIDPTTIDPMPDPGAALLDEIHDTLTKYARALRRLETGILEAENRCGAMHYVAKTRCAAIVFGDKPAPAVRPCPAPVVAPRSRPGRPGCVAPGARLRLRTSSRGVPVSELAWHPAHVAQQFALLKAGVGDSPALMTAIWRSAAQKMEGAHSRNGLPPRSVLPGKYWAYLWRRVGFSVDGRRAARPTEAVELFRGALPSRRFGRSWSQRRRVAQ